MPQVYSTRIDFLKYINDHPRYDRLWPPVPQQLSVTFVRPRKLSILIYSLVESPRTLLNATEWITAYTLLQTAPPGLSDAAHKALIAMFLSDSVIIEFMAFPNPNPAGLIFLPILLHPMSRGSSVSRQSFHFSFCCSSAYSTSSLLMQQLRPHSTLPCMSLPFIQPTRANDSRIALVSNHLSISISSPKLPNGPADSPPSPP